MATNEQPGSPRKPPGDLHVHGPSFPSSGTVERGTCIVWHNDGPTDLTITFKHGSPDGTPGFTLARERGQHRQEARVVGRFVFDARPSQPGGATARPPGSTSATGDGGGSCQTCVVHVV